MMKRTILYLALAAILASGCNKFLDQFPSGAYTDENYTDYPELVRGYVEKAYSLRPSHYLSSPGMACDGYADNMTWRDHSNAMWRYSTGASTMSDDPLAGLWTRCYTGIYYCNLFLQDNLGLSERYMVNQQADRNLRLALQGDAYALRAYYLYELLKYYGGRSVAGDMLGVPIFTEPVAPADADMTKIRRATYDACMEQILKDCDSALVYLPLANRDFLKEPEMIPVLGAVRYRRMDGISVKCLKALALLTWASPAFNPLDDRSRYDLAARAAKEVIDYKLTVESAGKVSGGFSLETPFSWSNPNDPEAIFVSQIFQGATYENQFYPQGFNGQGSYGPTQEFVDAFPAANGYPITDPRSGYDPAHPYDNRDPRFYKTIFYNGSQVVRNTNESDVMYIFDTSEGGKDAPGLVNTSPTGYYIRRHLYLGWNASDAVVQTVYRCIYIYRWTHMCLAFAEAANEVVGPLDETRYGLSAKQALAYVRNRPLEGNTPGVGAAGDPYLDECALGGARPFRELVRNEWRLETAFEGFRYHDVRRWATSVDEINIPIHRIKITEDAGVTRYEAVELERRTYPSLWTPIPTSEVRRTPLMLQNEGWEAWK